MSKLKDIRYLLKSQEQDGHLSLVKEYDRRNLGNAPIQTNGYLFHVVDFIIARTHGLYTATDLNGYLSGLISNHINPNSRKDFKEKGDCLEFGSLTFIERDVAQEWNKQKRIIKLYDQDIISKPEGPQRGKKITLKGSNHVMLDREINVRPFPDERIAAKYYGRNSISLHDLKLYQEMSEIERKIDNE